MASRPSRATARLATPSPRNGATGRKAKCRRASWRSIFQPTGLPVAIEQGLTPSSGSAVLGPDQDHPQVVIAANGGAELIYLTDPATEKDLAAKIVDQLTQQDYTAAIFVDEEKYGKI